MRLGVLRDGGVVQVHYLPLPLLASWACESHQSAVSSRYDLHRATTDLSITGIGFQPDQMEPPSG